MTSCTHFSRSLMLGVAIITTVLLLFASPLHAEPGQADYEDDWGDEEWGEEDNNLSTSHYLEAGFGTFMHDNAYVEQNHSLAEIRYRLDASNYWGEILGSIKADLIADDIEDKASANLREALIALPVTNNMDLKVGRQILTWGTGDLLFLNDLFPKDWVAFFSGRPMEYLKAPSDAIKLSVFSAFANADIVWTPVFNADEYLSGQRFSFYNPMSGELYGAPPALQGQEPDEKLENGELAVRIYKTVNALELALYGYRGFSKQPTAFDPLRMRPFFAAQQVMGASLLSPLAGGLFNTEFAWHYSLDDKDGKNPFIPNSQFRYLLGYEKEILSRLTASTQIYTEITRNYDALIRYSFNPEKEVEEVRTLGTVRLSYRALQDKLMLSLFGYYSPSDKDHYWLPKINYRFDDQLSLELGANLFGGQQRYTFFGQLEDNSNVYGRLRYSFAAK